MPRISKEDAERLLADVPDEHAFWCCDGRILRNTKELAETFATMEDETFSYHSNAEKNDFSDWVGAVIGDGKLARGLGKARNRTQAAKTVTNRIAFLGSKLA